MQPVSERIAEIQQRIAAIQQHMRQLDRTLDTQVDASDFTRMTDLAVRTMSADYTGHQADDPELTGIIANAAERYRLSPALLHAVIQVESGGNTYAVSPTGAQGLMQLMPSTAASLGVSDAFNPEQNVMAGAHYLRQQLDHFGGDLRKSLAAYNAGPGAVKRFNGVPPYPETIRYINKVLTLAGEE